MVLGWQVLAFDCCGCGLRAEDHPATGKHPRLMARI